MSMSSVVGLVGLFITAPCIFISSFTASHPTNINAVQQQTNGLFSFINYGLANADGGFGPRFLRLPSVGDYSTSMGTITYPYQINNSTDVGSKIDELSTLLTAGRLSAENKQVLQVSFFARCVIRPSSIDTHLAAFTNKFAPRTHTLISNNTLVMTLPTEFS